MDNHIKLLKEAIEVLKDKTNYKQLSKVPQNVIESNIYVRKVVNMFNSDNLAESSDYFKSTLFNWYKDNLKNTLYSKQYAESLK